MHNVGKRVGSFVQVSYRCSLRKWRSSASKAASTLDLELIRTILCGIDSLLSLTVVRDYVSTCEMPDIEDVVKIMAGTLGQNLFGEGKYFHILFSRSISDNPQNGDFAQLCPVLAGALSEVSSCCVHERARGSLRRILDTFEAAQNFRLHPE